MTRKPETAIVGKIMTALKAGGGFWFKVHGGPFQISGIPDIIGCYQGHFVGIEVKVPGEVPTELQWEQLKLIKEAKGRCGVATNVAEAIQIRDGR